MAKPSDVAGLEVSDSLHEAAVKILWARFGDMWSLRGPVMAGEDIEAIHDMRVASRRLRTLMQTVRPCFRARDFRPHYQRVRDLADLLGEVRDRDVVIEELERDTGKLPEDQRGALTRYIDVLGRERDQARDRLRTMLRELDGSGYEREFLSFIARSI